MKSNTCCQIWVNFFRNNQPVCYPELGRTHRHSFWFEPIRELVRSKTIWSYHIYHIWSWNLHPNPKKSRIISWWHLFHGTIFWHISTAWSQLWLLQCLNHLRQNAASQTGWVTGWVLVSFPNWSSWSKIVGFWLYNIWQHVGSAGGVCPAWNNVDCDYMWWVSAAVCCSCNHGVDFTVFFHKKCVFFSEVDCISCFQMQLIIECFDNVQTSVFFAKSGGKINNHL